MADIVAASACIPIGLEPIFFPQDFRWTEDEPRVCGEIAEYIAAHCGSDIHGNDGGHGALPPYLEDLYAKAVSDWEILKANPLHLSTNWRRRRRPASLYTKLLVAQQIQLV